MRSLSLLTLFMLSQTHMLLCFVSERKVRLLTSYIPACILIFVLLFLQSALVLCMDVGFSMSNSEPGQEPSFEQAKKVIQKFVQRQVCTFSPLKGIVHPKMTILS